ncbi:MAG: hypothetical protein RBS17_08845 [Coriobacteriia bacterium]|nr:hypothetical protein [Coriobacteriia bacterium]
MVFELEEPQQLEVSDYLVCGSEQVTTQTVSEPQLIGPTTIYESQPVIPATSTDESPEPMSVLGTIGVAQLEPESHPEYSLADELERLMSAAESQSMFLPPEAHGQTLASMPMLPLEPAYEAPPSLPPLSRGEALSVPNPAAPVVPAVTVTADYVLIAPVELQFTGGDDRVGVKPGTRSYTEFQRLAGIMLGDLQAARRR